MQQKGAAAGHEALKSETLRCIESHKPAFTLYTDGSASNGSGTVNGGAAMVITSGSAPHCHTVLDTWKRRGHEEEMEAMSMAVQWIIYNEPEGRVLICSDSQSLLKAIHCKRVRRNV